MCENCVLGPDICSSCAVHSGSPVCCPPADLIKHGCAPLCLCRTDKSLTSTQTRIRSARSWVRSKSPLMSCRPSPSSASPIRRTSRYCSYFSLPPPERAMHPCLLNGVTKATYIGHVTWHAVPTGGLTSSPFTAGIWTTCNNHLPPSLTPILVLDIILILSPTPSLHPFA